MTTLNIQPLYTKVNCFDKIDYMEFKEWLNAKFLEWEKAMPRRQSYSAFSRYLGVKQTTFSQWITGNGVPSLEKAALLSDKLGLEIYDVLGLRRPDADDPRAALRAFGFPPEVADDLAAILAEVLKRSLARMQKNGISKESPEGLEIVKEELSKLVPAPTDTK